MSSLNKAMVIGRLGENIELKFTSNGKAVANFSVATSIKTQSTDGYGNHNQKEEVEWHRIVVWEKLAENCQKFLSKGKLCFVEGRLATRMYEKDGQKHYSTEIIAHNVQFLSPKEEHQQVNQAINQQRSQTSYEEAANLPF